MTPLIPTIVTATIRVTRIRAVNKRGCIAFGHRVDVKEAVNDRSSAIVLTVPSTIAGSKDVVVGGIGRDDFSLNDAQRKAVRTSFAHRFSIITGGAGVGKTTVLKALYRALDTLGRPRFQMALSGRATARMIEATSESATTIAGFLSSVSAKEIGMHPIVVIDEASMLDLVTFYRLARKLPPDTHLILVGDPYQLPPIGAGLVLHVLCGHSEIAQTQLTEVKRQSKASEIPSAAQAVREGRWPDFTSNEAGEVILLPTSDAEIIPTVLRLYEQKREGTQILCATRSCRFAGVDALNRTCHVRYASHGRPLLAFSAESGQIESTGFCVYASGHHALRD